MHVSSQEPPVARRWAQNLYLGVASLILIGIVSEGLLIGPSLFASTSWGGRPMPFWECCSSCWRCCYQWWDY